MADGVAIISILASSTVALAAVAAQVWQGHLNRESERNAWLRDRRAEAYIAVFRLFAKTPEQVSREEWEHLTATLHAYGSDCMIGLFEKWGDAGILSRQEHGSERVHQKAYEDAVSLQSKMYAQVAVELQHRAIDRPN